MANLIKLLVLSLFCMALMASSLKKSSIPNFNGCGQSSDCIVYDITTNRTPCTELVKPATGLDWTSLDINLDFKRYGGRIVAYQIQWFNGKWSAWFVPGMNDLDTKHSNNRIRRQWSYFGDHSFKMILCKI